MSGEIETALYRILQEALTNIAKHAAAANVDILLERRADHISLIVEDDGCGFSAETGFEGSGKGLDWSACASVRRWCGTVDFESHPGDGMTVAVRIPTPQVEVRTHAESVRVLLADDHQIFREGCGCSSPRIRTSKSWGKPRTGTRAILLARQLRPHVIVIDISMPQLDGVRATQTLHDELPHIGVLVLTRHTDGGYFKA